MTFPPVIFQIVLVLMVSIAAVYDIRFRRIPNWLVLMGLVLGLGLNTFLLRWPGARASLLGIVLAFLIYFPLYLLRGMGAGDVKLMAAIGAIVGPANWFGIFIVSALLGGIVAVFLLLARGRLLNSLWNIGFLAQRLFSFRAPYAREELDISSPKSVKLPHGVAIACGSVLFLAAAWMWAPR
ncbi:MAG TPA: prepilin peptidase [Bryobacteraceae bacterium]|jgi:prepilin peptidase CpaA|nr:prepilin peptidase [Bryobacteraceae bacterium]